MKYTLLFALLLLVSCNNATKNVNTKKLPTEDIFIEASVKALGLLQAVADNDAKFVLSDQVDKMCKDYGFEQVTYEVVNGLKWRGWKTTTNEGKYRYDINVLDTTGVYAIELAWRVKELEDIVHNKQIFIQIQKALENYDMKNLDPIYQDDAFYYGGSIAGDIAINTEVRSSVHKNKTGDVMTIMFIATKK